MLHNPVFPLDIPAWNTRFAPLETAAVLDQVLNTSAFGKLALVSSFGAESAVLLHLLAQCNKNFPVLFIDTELLFSETLTYQTDLAAHLGLRNVQIIRADQTEIADADPNGDLHQSAPNRCCALRKTAPLARALRPYDGWISGRKRYHGGQRTQLDSVETDDTGKLKINPLARWSAADMLAYRIKHALPAHPLIAKGYRSIGCQPCTSPVRENEPPRAGRWRGQDKTECGIHFPLTNR